MGDSLVLHGHGLRPRTVIVRADGRSVLTEIAARRYVCRACDAVALVVPADVARRCLYTLTLIAAALASWSHGGLAAHAVRAAFSAFSVLGAAATGWPSLKRWTGMVTQLWPRLGEVGSHAPRVTSGRITAKLAAFAIVPSGSLLDDAPAGAVHAT